MVAVRAACAALAVLACACAVVDRIRRAQGGFVYRSLTARVKLVLDPLSL